MPPTTLKNPNQQVPQEMVDKLNFLKGEVAKLAKTTPVNKIPAGSLNTAPFTPPPAVNSTTYKGNLASNIALNSPTVDEIKQSQAQQNAPVDPKQATLDRINQIVGIQSGRGQDVLQAQEDVGLAQKREALKVLDDKTLRLTQAYEKEVKDIEKNAQGSLDIGVKQRLSDAETRYLDKKADLAIDRLASQGDIETALAIVEDKIKAKYEPLENELKTLQTYYSLYQDDLTESQKVKLQQEFQTKQDTLNFQREKEMVDYTAKIKAKYDTPSIPKTQVVDVGGRKFLINEATGETIKEIGGDSVSKSNVTSALNNISLVDELLKDNRYENVVGLNRFNPLRPFMGDSQYALNQFNQLMGTISLDNREKLKGSGAVSDFEFKVLGQASSALGQNLSNTSAEKELVKIKGAFANMAGLPALVKITDPNTGKSVNVKATRETINQALIDGANVEYIRE